MQRGLTVCTFAILTCCCLCLYAKFGLRDTIPSISVAPHIRPVLQKRRSWCDAWGWMGACGGGGRHITPPATGRYDMVSSHPSRRLEYLAAVAGLSDVYFFLVSVVRGSMAHYLKWFPPKDTGVRPTTALTPSEFLGFGLIWLHQAL